MVADLLIDLVLFMVRPVLGLMPEFDLSALTTAVGSGATAMGSYAMMVDGILPVSELFTFLSVLATLLPVVMGYKVFSWVWRHVPTVAGFGTGNG